METTNIRYRCLLCGRDKFTRKVPHVCRNGFQKRHLKWETLENGIVIAQNPIQFKPNNSAMKYNDLYLNQGKRPDQINGSEKAGCLAAIFFLIMILIGMLTSCNPYPRLTKPARMGYSVDGILCRTYQVDKDTIKLFDAGYWAFKRVQKRGAEITLIDNHVIVKMK